MRNKKDKKKAVSSAQHKKTSPKRAKAVKPRKPAVKTGKQTKSLPKRQPARFTGKPSLKSALSLHSKAPRKQPPSKQPPRQSPKPEISPPPQTTTPQSIPKTREGKRELLRHEEASSHAAPASKEKKGIKVGDPAPDFTLKDQFGNDVRLSAFKGKKVLLSFHPLAWTPICELQMRALELKKNEFDKLNTVPLGISVDSLYTKREWATFIELDQMQILADFWPHGEVAKKYGQFIEKNGTSGRANILVDETGKIVWMKVYDIKQLPDIEEVLAAIREKSIPSQ